MEATERIEAEERYIENESKYRSIVREVLAAGPTEWADLVGGPLSRSDTPLPVTAEGLACAVLQRCRYLNPEFNISEARIRSRQYLNEFNSYELVNELRRLDKSSLF